MNVIVALTFFSFTTTNDVKVTASACQGNVRSVVETEDGSLEKVLVGNDYVKNTKVEVPAGTRFEVIAEFDRPDIYVVLFNLEGHENATGNTLRVFLRKNSFEKLMADQDAEKVQSAAEKAVIDAAENEAKATAKAAKVAEKEAAANAAKDAKAASRASATADVVTEAEDDAGDEAHQAEVAALLNELDELNDASNIDESDAVAA